MSRCRWPRTADCVETMRFRTSKTSSYNTPFLPLPLHQPSRSLSPISVITITIIGVSITHTTSSLQLSCSHMYIVLSCWYPSSSCSSGFIVVISTAFGPSAKVSIINVTLSRFTVYSLYIQCIERHIFKLIEPLSGPNTSH
ncbi:hypothetical protein CPB86DRAFT_87878 [Serendipita vermifera]|nr:hypothetical protein CPB86DRAFT_87878 [Serendipita vermifera]